MATIKDVAARAGVSVSLVSHYLNGRKGVGPESRRRIEEAIEALHYRPNELARSLVRQRTNTIGVMVSHLSNPFLFGLFDGIESGAADYNIVYCSASIEAQKRKRYFEFFLHGRADALIVYGSGTADEELVHDLTRSGFPVVLIESKLPDNAAGRILIDSFAAGKEATEYLLSLGHRELLFISGMEQITAVKDRRMGFETACAAAEGVRPHILRPEYPDKGQVSRQMLFEEAYHAMQRYLKENPPPHAIFSSGDILAYGAVQALRENGLRVPEDVSVVGFDDEPGYEFGMTFPRLTTMRQPLSLIGQLAVKAAIAQIGGEQPRETVVSTELIDRGTCIQRM